MTIENDQIIIFDQNLQMQQKNLSLLGKLTENVSELAKMQQKASLDKHDLPNEAPWKFD